MRIHIFAWFMASDGKNRDSMEKDAMEIADKLLPNLTRKEKQYLKSLYWDYKDKYGWKKD